MVKKHIVEILVEANKEISNVISQLEKDTLKDNQIIDHVNDVIRQLDGVVEQLEKHKL